MTRFAPRFLALLLCGTALCACASHPDLKDTLGVKDKPPVSDKQAASDDLDSNVRQAQLLRLAGHYDEAIHTLSQLMLIAADDPRVVSEYGKTLAQQGRAAEATQFLRRAIEITPNDWTLYSALGVSYDQAGDQTNARAAYEHALALRPGEASVLNNYALSRMLANDPASAKLLIARAQIAGGTGVEKIARNVALIKAMAPDPDGKAPSTVANSGQKGTLMVAQATTAAPERQAKAAAQALIARQPLMLPSAPAPNGAPRVLQPAPQFVPAPPQLASLQPYPEVVMQRVPDDPLAGPVKPRARVAFKPKPTAADKNEVKAAKSAPKDGAPVKAAAKTKANVKAAANKDPVPALRLAADARNP